MRNKSIICVLVMVCLGGFLGILFGIRSCGSGSSEKKVVVREYVEVEGEIQERSLIQRSLSNVTEQGDSSIFEGGEAREEKNSYKHEIKEIAPKEFRWKLPQGWIVGDEKPMRVFTARIETGQECVITIFPGDVGGLQSNLERWLMQLGRKIKESEIEELIVKSEVRKGGEYPFLFVDLRPYTLQNKESAYIAIFRFKDATLFVKLTSTGSSLNANKKRFLEFVKSIARK